MKPRSACAVLGLLLLGATLSSCGDNGNEASKAAAEKKSREMAPLDRSVVTFERGRYYTPTVANDAARTFSAVTDDERRLAAEVRRELKKARGLAEIQQHLADARTLESQALLDVVDDLLKHADAEVRTLALTLIEGVNSPAVVPPLRDSLTDSGVEVRIQAMEVAQHVVDPAIREVLLQAMEDENVSVRQLALQAARNQGAEFNELAVARAATSPKEDMAAAGLTLIEASPSKKTVNLVMRGLDHPSERVREQAHEMLFLTMHQSFPNAAAAQTWWKQNQTAFDDDLVIVDPERFIQR